MKDDPIIQQIREVRRQISAEFQHDPARLVAHYIELEKQSRRRFVRSNLTEAMEEEPEDIENILKVSPIEPSVAH